MGAPETTDPRLPKQFTHWAKEFGFVRSGFRKSRRTFSYENRRTGRRLRVNCHAELQVCDGDFDRWANSVGGSTSMPKSQREFRAAMRGFGWTL